MIQPKHIIYVLLSAFSALCCVEMNAQVADDAILFNSFYSGGTARNIGVGGSLSVLGGDFGAIVVNPAGLGIYRSSELSMTLGYHSPNTEAGFGSGALTNANRNKLNVQSMAWVSSSAPVHGSVYNSNFSIGFQKTDNFNQRSSYNGSNVGSISDRFLELADGLLPDELDNFEAGPAFDAGAIFPDADGTYFSDYRLEPGMPVLDKTVTNTTSGAKHEFLLAYGANLKDRFYLGASIGIPIIDYRRERNYDETDPSDAVFAFNSLNFQDDLEISGAGINLNLGIIYRASQNVRLGLAIHTPSFYTLEETYSSSVQFSFDEDGSTNSIIGSAPENVFDYTFRTPFRYIGSVGILMGRLGFITAEAEYINHAASAFSLDGDFDADEALVNADIDNLFDASLNFRLGAELAHKSFRLRGGLQLNQDPAIGLDDYTSTYSAGIGFRLGRYILDAAYTRSSLSSNTVPYRVSTYSAPAVSSNKTTEQILLTMGMRF